MAVTGRAMKFIPRWAATLSLGSATGITCGRRTLGEPGNNEYEANSRTAGGVASNGRPNFTAIRHRTCRRHAHAPDGSRIKATWVARLRRLTRQIQINSQRALHGILRRRHRATRLITELNVWKGFISSSRCAAGWRRVIILPNNFESTPHLRGRPAIKAEQISASDVPLVSTYRIFHRHSISATGKTCSVTPRTFTARPERRA